MVARSASVLHIFTLRDRGGKRREGEGGVTHSRKHHDDAKVRPDGALQTEGRMGGWTGLGSEGVCMRNFSITP